MGGDSLTKPQFGVPLVKKYIYTEPNIPSAIWKFLQYVWLWRDIWMCRKNPGMMWLIQTFCSPPLRPYDWKWKALENDTHVHASNNTIFTNKNNRSTWKPWLSLCPSLAFLVVFQFWPSQLFRAGRGSVNRASFPRNTCVIIQVNVW